MDFSFVLLLISITLAPSYHPQVYLSICSFDILSSNVNSPKQKAETADISSFLCSGISRDLPQLVGKQQGEDGQSNSPYHFVASCRQPLKPQFYPQYLQVLQGTYKPHLDGKEEVQLSYTFFPQR